MIELEYSLIIEVTEDPEFFGFYSLDLEGFTGIGHSIEDCLYKAKWGMKEHVNLLEEQGLPIPPKKSKSKDYHSKRGRINYCIKIGHRNFNLPTKDTKHTKSLLRTLA